MKKHKHIFTPWKKIDLEGILEYNICKICGEVTLKGNNLNWMRRYK